MVVAELTYKRPLEDVEKFLVAHREFLQTYYDKGLFIASGPKNQRDGGIIIALVDKKKMGELMKEDPFYKNDIADYRFIQFEAVKCCKELVNLL